MLARLRDWERLLALVSLFSSAGAASSLGSSLASAGFLAGSATTGLAT
jgi:hypothetical protein